MRRLENQKVVFNGTLNTMTRKQAQSLLLAFGIEAKSSVTTETTVLVVDTIPTNLFNEDSRTKKLIAAEEYKVKGQAIMFLTELEFLSSSELTVLKPLTSLKDFNF